MPFRCRISNFFTLVVIEPKASSSYFCACNKSMNVSQFTQGLSFSFYMCNWARVLMQRKHWLHVPVIGKMKICESLLRVIVLVKHGACGPAGCTMIKVSGVLPGTICMLGPCSVSVCSCVCTVLFLESSTFWCWMQPPFVQLSKDLCQT